MIAVLPLSTRRQTEKKTHSLLRKAVILKTEKVSLHPSFSTRHLSYYPIVAGKYDYSGFATKTDPVEIKLVRKMDIYIMISLWSMYWVGWQSKHAYII